MFQPPDQSVDSFLGREDVAVDMMWSLGWGHRMTGSKALSVGNESFHIYASGPSLECWHDIFRWMVKNMSSSTYKMLWSLQILSVIRP